MMLLQVPIQLLCIILADGFLHIQYFHFHRAGAELYFYNISCLDIHGYL